MKLLKFGTIALDGAKVKANASKHKALSYGHAKKLEAPLKTEVNALIQRAEAADNDVATDGMDIPAEIARREARLAAIAEAKVKIEARAQERDAAEQTAYQDKVAKRDTQRKAGKKPRGRDPKPPMSGPRDKDQVNLTDPQSRIMPVTGKGFDKCYNAQAVVDTESMQVTSVHVTQATNDKQQVMPLLNALTSLPASLGKVTHLLADTGYFSAENVKVCAQQGIEPLIAMKLDVHHLPLFERFAVEPVAPGSDEPRWADCLSPENTAGTGPLCAAQTYCGTRIRHHQACYGIQAVLTPRVG